MNTKQCKTCGEVKLLEAFRKSDNNAQGRKPHCKDCQKAMYHGGGSRFNDEADLDWRDEDLEAKNRFDYWVRNYGYESAVAKASMRLP